MIVFEITWLRAIRWGLSQSLHSLAVFVCVCALPVSECVRVGQIGVPV